MPYGLGAGKGQALVAYVGALYEALEHAFCGPTSLQSLPLQVVSSQDVATATWSGDRALEQVRASHGTIACLRYDSLHGGAEQLLPVGLWAPWYVAPLPVMVQFRDGVGDDYDYTPLTSYCGNTGCAIGSSRDEALLHALNEWVERDALSLFLLSSVYDGSAMPAQIDVGAIPPPVAAVVADVQARFAEPVCLLDLTTDIGIPVVMAYLPGCPGRSGPRYGMGASLHAGTAVERAVTELVQGELLGDVVRREAAAMASKSVDDDDKGEQGPWPSYRQLVAEHDIDAAVAERLAPHPRLLACARLAFSDRVTEGGWTSGPADCVAPGTGVDHQWRIAVERINAAGHPVLATTLRVLPRGSTLVQVQCPGLERFHLVTKGHLALPGARGRAFRARSVAAP